MSVLCSRIQKEFVQNHSFKENMSSSPHEGNYLGLVDIFWVSVVTGNVNMFECEYV
jgi:hypothetical protein